MTKLAKMLIPAVVAATAHAADWTVFIGTYTGGESKGIYSLHFDSVTGKLTNPVLAIESSKPSFLAIHGKYLYAANENQDGSVSAFAIDGDRLTLQNRVSSRGAGPCHISLDRTGKWLFVANYVSGSVAAFPVHDDGSLGEASAFVQHAGSSIDHERQEGPHAHEVVPSPDNRHLLVADLGVDQVFTYNLDATRGTLMQAGATKVAPGSGPRHLVFNGAFVYVLNELNATVDAFRWNGNLQPIGSAPMLPAGYAGTKSGAEIAVHPNGKFLYASNRGHDSIAIFSIGSLGKLAPLGHVPTAGKTPRNFAIDPTGNFLLAANQESSSVVVFRVDSKTGLLKPIGSSVTVPTPVSIVFAGLDHAAHAN